MCKNIFIQKLIYVSLLIITFILKLPLVILSMFNDIGKFPISSNLRLDLKNLEISGLEICLDIVIFIYEDSEK